MIGEWEDQETGWACEVEWDGDGHATARAFACRPDDDEVLTFCDPHAARLLDACLVVVRERARWTESP